VLTLPPLAGEEFGGSMRQRIRTLIGCAFVLSVQTSMGEAQDRPPPGSVIAGRPAWRYDPAQRCPGLEVSPKGYGAVVDFFVNTSGMPSKAFISTSSHSDTLDAAALACVGKLRFQPAAKLGEGSPIDSWQRIALKAEDPPPQVPAAAAAAPAATGAPAATAAAPVASATPSVIAPAAAATAAAAGGAAMAATTKAAPAAPAASAPRAVEVRECADASGKAQEPTVAQSSGNPQLDQAALTVARSGSAYLRQAAQGDGKAAPGCLSLTVKFATP
jgi:TonB family protein